MRKLLSRAWNFKRNFFNFIQLVEEKWKIYN